MNNSHSFADLKERADKLLQDGNAVEASQLYQYALTSDPTNATTCCNYGIALSACGNCKGAIEYFMKAIELDAKLMPAWLNLLRLHAIEHDWPAVIGLYRLSLERDINLLSHNPYAILRAFAETECHEEFLTHVDNYTCNPGCQPAILILAVEECIRSRHQSRGILYLARLFENDFPVELGHDTLERLIALSIPTPRDIERLIECSKKSSFPLKWSCSLVRALNSHGRDLDAIKVADAIQLDSCSSSDDLCIKALCCLLTGQYSQAIDYYAKAYLTGPKSIQCTEGLSQSLWLAKSHPMRRELLEAMAGDSSLQIQSLQFIARACLDEGLYTAALNCCEAALSIDSGIDAFIIKANTLSELGKDIEAISTLTQGISHHPDSFELNLNLGAFYKRGAFYEEAKTFLAKALDQNDNCAEAYANLADIYYNTGYSNDALAYARKALAIDPDLYLAKCTIGAVLTEEQDIDEALTWLNRARDQYPESPVPYLLLAHAYKEGRQLETALECLYEAKSRNYNGQLKDLHLSFDDILTEMGRFQDAESVLTEALDASASDSSALYSLSLHQLRAGKYYEGWANYHHRWHSDNRVLRSSLPEFSQQKPVWDGSPCNSIYVWAEQGLGDEIMYASMLRDLASYSNQIIVQVDRRLIDLSIRSFPANYSFVPRDAQPSGDEYDRQIPMGDLGRYLRSSVSDFKRCEPKYLHLDPGKTQYHRRLIRSLHPGKKIIGISWASPVNRYRNKVKGLDIRDIVERLSSHDTAFLSLQYSHYDDEVRQASRDTAVPIDTVDWIDKTDDIDGVAHLCAACDEIVTISNTTAAICGAFGIAAHVLLPFSPGWIWGLKSNKSLWWPSLRLYRQQLLYDWDIPLNDIRLKISAT